MFLFTDWKLISQVINRTSRTDFLLTWWPANPCSVLAAETQRFWLPLLTPCWFGFPPPFAFFVFVAVAHHFGILGEKNAVFFFIFACWQDLLCYYKMDDIIQLIPSAFHLFFSVFSFFTCFSYVTESRQSGWNSEPLLCTERGEKKYFPFPNDGHSCCVSLSVSVHTINPSFTTCLVLESKWCKMNIS